MRLQGKVAVITGAGSGIGLATARLFATEGASVILADIKDASEEAAATSARCASVLVDVADALSVQHLFEQTLKRFGRLDILVNNAGIDLAKRVTETDEAEWDRLMSVNLKGVFLCTQCAARVMREKGYGKIINISSVSWRGNPGQLNYSATKAGIIGMTKTAAKELAPKGVNVNVIAPGMIWTDMLTSMPPAIVERMEKGLAFIVPLNRKGQSRDVANLALFLASDESSYITGQLIHCDGGMIM